MTDHPISPPSELVQQWMEEADTFRYFVNEVQQYIAARAAHWGYDQRGEVNEAKLQQARDEELEACREWLKSEGHEHEHEALFAARRPKPPSLKKQALHALGSPIMIGESRLIGHRDHDLLCRALEALPDD